MSRGIQAIILVSFCPKAVSENLKILRNPYVDLKRLRVSRNLYGYMDIWIYQEIPTIILSSLGTSKIIRMLLEDV